MESNTKKLISVLKETIDLLNKHGVIYWVNLLENDRDRIIQADYHGIEHLLSIFGGMGSFNDLYICEENGHIIEEDQVLFVNEKLMKLANEIYKLAEEILKKKSS